MQRQGRGYDFETVRARMLYRELVVPPRPPHPLAVGRMPIRKPGKKLKKRRPDPASPRSNAGKMRRARKKNDVFTGLMGPPKGFVERFRHFEQLELFRDMPGKGEQETTAHGDSARRCLPGGLRRSVHGRPLPGFACLDGTGIESKPGRVDHQQRRRRSSLDR
jgi:hypothetical protein